MGRIPWIDSSRGLAILCLIIIHNVGALNSRGYISVDILNKIELFFRVATPYFILIFGFTFSIVHSHRLIEMESVKNLYKKLVYRLVLVLLARQVIVIISSIRHPELVNDLWSILFYDQLSQSGEILTFYFMAIVLAPISLYFIRSNSKNTNGFIIFLIYSVSYYIGSTYNQYYESVLFRVLFYDVYAFFPFFSLAMIGMLLGILYKDINSNVTRLRFFLFLAIFSIGLGSALILYITPTPIESLAKAELKAPPHIVYILIYFGMSIIITTMLALYSTNKHCPQIPIRLLGVLGRNSLLSYVLHYFLFIASPVSIYIFGVKNSTYELVTFISVFFLMYIIVYSRDYYKKQNSNKEWCNQ